MHVKKGRTFLGSPTAFLGAAEASVLQRKVKRLDGLAALVSPSSRPAKGFAGIPIVEAYRYGQSLEGAIVALAKSAERHMTGIKERHGEIGRGERYAVPIKGKDAEPGHVLDVISDKHGASFAKDDPKQAVAEAFRAHRKDVPPSVYSKISNTETLIRFLLRTRTN